MGDHEHKLTRDERLDRLERAFTDGLQIDLALYDEREINAARAAAAEEQGIPEREEEFEESPARQAALAEAAEPVEEPEPVIEGGGQ